jgi:hypothetical protein
MSKSRTCSCPYCGFTVEIPEDHEKEHDKICCMNCNKAFPVPPKKTNYGFPMSFDIDNKDWNE